MIDHWYGSGVLITAQHDIIIGQYSNNTAVMVEDIDYRCIVEHTVQKSHCPDHQVKLLSTR